LETAGELRGGSDAWPQLPWYRSPRARLFGLVAACVLALGCLWTALQETTWRSMAIVLMSSPVAADATFETADTQNVAIQSRILLGPEVLESLASRLRANQSLDMAPRELAQLLQVVPVEETNLVEMAAEGPDADILPPLVNNWIDAYLELWAQEALNRKVNTLRQVEDELASLEVKLEQARDSLDRYRRENDIISAQREENEIASRLGGLNRALNNAMEEEVKTGAQLDTLLESLRRGERIVPREQRQDVQALEREYRGLQKKLTEVEKRYTEKYINKDPELTAMADRVQELEVELQSAYETGAEIELGSARQAHAAAREAVADLQARLAADREQVAEFTRIYATHDALVADLARLEELYREAQARQVKVAVRDVEKYPEVSVIQRAPEESERTGPDYAVLLGGTVGLAFLLGLLSVWLQGFLGHQTPSPTYVSVEVVPPAGPRAGDLDYERKDEPRLSEASARRLDDDSDRGPEN
jgi:uncharacterized protein involved in exopolysaccharide biosynthesis